MQPLFEHLGNEAFLVVCEGFYTQTRNECLHHVIWGMTSNEMFSPPPQISLAVSLGMLHFNWGFSAPYTQLLPPLGIRMQLKMHEMWRKIDLDRIYQSDYRSSFEERKKERRSSRNKMPSCVRKEEKRTSCMHSMSGRQVELEKRQDKNGP